MSETSNIGTHPAVRLDKHEISATASDARIHHQTDDTSFQNTTALLLPLALSPSVAQSRD